MTSRRAPGRRFLLDFGLGSSALYGAMLLIVPMLWDGYSSASQTVSELSAIGAPTRTLWVTLGLAWAALYVGFGWEIREAGQGNRRLRALGSVIILAGLVSLVWPPMHRREILAAGGGTWTDTLHIAWTIMNAILTIAAMGLGAAALGPGFRVYSILTIVLLVGAGLATAADGPRINANLPTPTVGVWERLNLAAWLVWVAVLALLLGYRPVATPGRGT